MTATEFRQLGGSDSEGDKGQPNSLDSYSTQQRPFSVSEVNPGSSSTAAAAPVLRSMPDPGSTRSKVFRHKLQKTLKQQVDMMKLLNRLQGDPSTQDIGCVE